MTMRGMIVTDTTATGMIGMGSTGTVTECMAAWYLKDGRHARLHEYPMARDHTLHVDGCAPLVLGLACPCGVRRRVDLGSRSRDAP